MKKWTKKYRFSDQRCIVFSCSVFRFPGFGHHVPGVQLYHDRRSDHPDLQARGGGRQKWCLRQAVRLPSSGAGRHLTTSGKSHGLGRCEQQINLNFRGDFRAGFIVRFQVTFKFCHKTQRITGAHETQFFLDTSMHRIRLQELSCLPKSVQSTKPVLRRLFEDQEAFKWLSFFSKCL